MPSPPRRYLIGIAWLWFTSNPRIVPADSCRNRSRHSHREPRQVHSDPLPTFGPANLTCPQEPLKGLLLLLAQIPPQIVAAQAGSRGSSSRAGRSAPTPRGRAPPSSLPSLHVTHGMRLPADTGADAAQASRAGRAARDRRRRGGPVCITGKHQGSIRSVQGRRGRGCLRLQPLIPRNSRPVR